MNSSIKGCQIVCMALATIILAGCNALPPTPSFTLKVTPEATPQMSPISTVTATSCQLSAVAVPTLPATIPGYGELDSATGLHVTGQFQKIGLGNYRLKVTGQVDNPLDLTFDELRCMRKIRAYCILICPDFFQDTATWAGTPISSILERAHVRVGATQVELLGADGYKVSVALEMALSQENFLAYEWEGEPLPILHGFPVRAVFPFQSGGKWVKWLVQMNVH